MMRTLSEGSAGPGFDRAQRAPSTLLEPGRTVWRMAHANRVAVLVDGEDYYGAVAKAFLLARHSIFLLGWDVHSRIDLLRGNAADALPSSLGARLDALLARHPHLHVYVLDWDYPLLFAQERESRIRLLTDWPSSPRFHFRYDAAHPSGASQHQKIIVVDDAVAWCGGMDIGFGRWDTREHLARDERRCDPGFGPYVPGHDVMMMADDEVARVAGELARERWRLATGEDAVDAVPVDGDRWPTSVAPDAEDVEVGFSRTLAAHAGRPAVFEVEALHVEAIAAARRWIYIENQYLTSDVVVEALVQRLRESDGPEIVVALPQNNFGWFESRTIQVLHFGCIRRLRDADLHERLRVCYPLVPEIGDAQVNLHSKVLVVDDRLLKVGSSNLTNRSMRLDSECDWSIESGADDDRVAAAIASVRHRLLGEHLCLSEAEVARALEQHGSLVALVDAQRGSSRCLRQVEPEPEESVDLGDGTFVDPKEPLSAEAVIETFAKPDVRRRARPRLARLVLLLVVLASLAAMWQWTPLREWIHPESLAGLGTRLRESPVAPFGVLAAYLVASVLVIPVTVMVLATASLFGPWYGIAYSLAGSLVSGWLAYELGRHRGRLVELLTHRQYRRIAEGLRDRGVATMLVLRLLPVAPYTIVNLVVGASGIGRREFLLGTAIGMTPGIVALSLFQAQLVEAVRTPSAGSIAALVALCAAIVTALAWLQRRLRVRRRRMEDQGRCAPPGGSSRGAGASSGSRSRFTSTSATSG